MRNVFILFSIFLFSCNIRDGRNNSANQSINSDQISNNQTNTTLENPFDWIDSFPQKIKLLQKSFYRYGLNSYDCLLIDEFFYDSGTKVNMKDLVQIDTTLCHLLFENAISAHDIICNSYLYSIEKPFMGFYPITVINPLGVTERPLILILFDANGNYVNSIEVADSYGESGGCLKSYFLNDSVLKQEKRWDKYDIDSLDNDVFESSFKFQKVIFSRNGTYQIHEVVIQ